VRTTTGATGLSLTTTPEGRQDVKMMVKKIIDNTESIFFIIGHFAGLMGEEWKSLKCGKRFLR